MLPMTDEPQTTIHNSSPPEGWTREERDTHLAGLTAETRAKEEQAKRDGTWGKRMHYGSHPWGDDGDGEKAGD